MERDVFSKTGMRGRKWVRPSGRDAVTVNGILQKGRG